MAFNDLLSTSFLFSIAIIIILIGAIFAYVSYRMSEQDHKISSMLGLISTMAEELQFFRNKLSNNSDLNTNEVNLEPKNVPFLDPNNLLNLVTLSNNTQLISVSDDEDLEESEDELEDDEESDDETDTQDLEDDLEDELEDESDDELEEDLDDDLDAEINFGGRLNLNLEEVIHLEDTEQLVKNNVLENSNNIKSIHLEDPIELNYNINNEFKNNDLVDDLLVSDLKSISITDLEETNKKQDYKKMSINELKKVVLNKGIVPDASKLQKNELLKLLGDE